MRMLSTLIVLLICSTPLGARAQLFDGERQGLLIGGGLGFAAILDDDGDSDFTASGHIGYGLWDELTLYFSSPVPDFVPSLGFKYYPAPRSDLCLQGLLGYTSDSSGRDSRVSIAGGIGYQLRDHVTLEAMLGYNRFSYRYRFFWYANDHTVDIFTISATINLYLY